MKIQKNCENYTKDFNNNNKDPNISALRLETFKNEKN